MKNVQLTNHGTVNKNSVTLETDEARLTIYFSYETPVSFQYLSFDGTGKPAVNATRVNDWSVTTGKFLDELCPDKKDRIEGEEFEKLLQRYLKKM